MEIKSFPYEEKKNENSSKMSHPLSDHLMEYQEIKTYSRLFVSI